MWNLARSTCALLIASCTLAHGASAQDEEEESEVSEFWRSGFYLGAGATAGFPTNWDRDIDNDLNEFGSFAATSSGQANLGAAGVPGSVKEVDVVVDGADLEDVLFGANGVVGYRLGGLLAFEVEGEWIGSENHSNLKVSALLSDQDPEETVPQESTGRHKFKVEKIWTLTANVKAFAPFEIFAARLQPFGKIGVGVQSSKVKVRLMTEGLTTTNGNGLVEVSADFEGRGTKRSTDGAMRVGGGFDFYATRNILSEVSATYVVPFSKVFSMRTDYVSLQWRLIYRF